MTARGPETFDEQIARLEMLAGFADGSRQICNDQDRAAIRALLESYTECVGESLRRAAELRRGAK